MPRTSDYAIYVITSTDYWYVGSSAGAHSSPERRFAAHLNGYGGAPLLHERIMDIGPAVFELEVLERGYGDPIAAEARWFDLGLATETRKCLNRRRPGITDGYWLNHELTRAHRAHIGAALRGRRRSPLTSVARARISLALRGRPHAPEHVRKVADANRGQCRVASPAVRRALAVARCARWNLNQRKPCGCGYHVAEGVSV